MESTEAAAETYTSDAISALLGHCDVLEYVFAALEWAPELRLVSRAWRRIYDARVWRDAAPFSRMLYGADQLEAAVAAGAHTRCRLRVYANGTNAVSRVRALPNGRLELVGTEDPPRKRRRVAPQPGVVDSAPRARD